MAIFYNAVPQVEGIMLCRTFFRPFFLCMLPCLGYIASHGPLKLKNPSVARWAHGGIRRQRCRGVINLKGHGRVGERYSWYENDWEIEVTVPVPKATRKQDVLFKATTKSVKLGLVNSTELLLAGKLKGKIALDGSYWSLEGSDEEDKSVKILLEKKENELENRWEWEGLLIDEEPTEKTYEPHERFDTKQYLNDMLGPEGLQEDLVDQSMFDVGIGNVTKDMLGEWAKKGAFRDDTQPLPNWGEDEVDEDV